MVCNIPKNERERFKTKKKYLVRFNNFISVKKNNIRYKNNDCIHIHKLSRTIYLL